MMKLDSALLDIMTWWTKICLVSWNDSFHLGTVFSTKTRSEVCCLWKHQWACWVKETIGLQVISVVFGYYLPRIGGIWDNLMRGIPVVFVKKGLKSPLVLQHREGTSLDHYEIMWNTIINTTRMVDTRIAFFPPFNDGSGYLVQGKTLNTGNACCHTV